MATQPQAAGSETASRLRTCARAAAQRESKRRGRRRRDAVAWQALAANDPLKQRSRFHRLRLAWEAAEPSLPSVLADLKANRRRNVLIVPGVFCAPPEKMRALRDAAAPVANGLTLTWLPGLGRSLATAAD